MDEYQINNQISIETTNVNTTATENFSATETLVQRNKNTLCSDEVSINLDTTDATDLFQMPATDFAMDLTDLLSFPTDMTNVPTDLLGFIISF